MSRFDRFLIAYCLSFVGALFVFVYTKPVPVPVPVTVTTHETCVRFESYDVCHADTTSTR